MSNATRAARACQSSLPVSDESGVRYPVAELFCTLQGEGAHTGRAAVFVRTGGCDVGCPWCDSPSAQTTRGCRMMTAEEIVNEVAGFRADMTVITGGEPLIHDLTPLTAELERAGRYVALETSGTHRLSGRFDWICVSPKRFARPSEGMLSAASELKVVISGEEDFAFAEECAAECVPGCRLSLQPEWGVRERVTPAIIAYIKEHPQWRLSLQTHKFIDIP